MAFNSPVWFNIGVERAPVPTCFINSVEDSMESILSAKTEGMLFGGPYRYQPLTHSSTGATQGWRYASGPVSFMRGFDAFAGVIKSDGKTRVVQQMVILDIDHPDIMEFIDQGREAQGLVTDRRGLRRRIQRPRRCIRLRILPELEQLCAGHGCVHEGRRDRR